MSQIFITVLNMSITANVVELVLSRVFWIKWSRIRNSNISDFSRHNLLSFIVESFIAEIKRTEY